MTADLLVESMRRLQPMLDSFSDSLSHLCESNDEVFALCKDLEDHYRHLHKDILSRYETLKQQKKQIHISTAQPQVKREIKQEKSVAIAGYSPPKILPVKVQPELEHLCLRNNGYGLRNLIFRRKKMRAVAKLREELPVALSKAPDPGKLVLEAIQGYNFSEKSSASKEALNSKRAYILLLECLFPVFRSDENPFVPEDVKDKARKIANFWRQQMGFDKDVKSADELDIQAFLQLLTTFRIGQDYGQDELCELLLPIAELRESPALCLFLGLYSKIPDFLDSLSKSGKWIECIRYAHAFGMMDKIKPADLLKEYLENVKKVARDILKEGQGSVDSQKNSTKMEKCALNRAISIVKEYDLENVYSIEDLQNKVQRMEQDQAPKGSLAAKRKVEDEKKAVDATKKENKAAPADARKQKKAADIKDETNREDKKTHRKRLQSSEPANSSVGFFGTEARGERGLYRPSQRPKHVLEEDFNRVAGGQRNRSSGIDLLARYQSSYHDDIRNTMEPSSVMPVNDQQQYYDSYPSTSGYSNINPIGASLYGSSSMIGAVSSFNQSQVNQNVRTQQSYMPSRMASAYTVSSNNPVQSHSEGRTLQSYTSALGAVDKCYFASPRHGKSGLTNSLSSLAQNTSAFGGNLSNTGSSVHGSGDPLAYNSGDYTVPSYFALSNLERGEPEQQKTSFAISNLSEFGQASSVGCQSAISKYQFNGGLRF